MKPEEILAAARKLRDERFAVRNAALKQRADERFNLTTVEVPAAYRKTSLQTTADGKIRPSSNIIADEGRQIGTLVYAVPVPHLTPLQPEDQPLTTKAENFLTAMLQQLEDHYGPVNWQCTSAQVHDNITWLFTAPKRKPYKGQPKAPTDDAEMGEKEEYGLKNERFKKDAGIASVFDYEYAATGTVMYDGSVFDPNCIYIWKEVPASTFKKTYGEMENVTGRPEGSGGAESTVNVVEYWDREECVIICETRDSTWLGMKQVRGTQILDHWTHNWGRVPYFARPCFITEQLDEDKKFEGPLDGIHNEMPYHKRLMAMIAAVAYQTAFSPLVIETEKDQSTILDDTARLTTFIEFEPGKARELNPGQKVTPLGQSPEVRNLYFEMGESHKRLERFMLSPVSKGVSPGADTANAALSNLHRFQLSSLDPMASQAARQWSAIFRFWLERVQAMGETVYAFNSKTDQHTSLNAEDIVSVNVQAKTTPDQGQFQLLIEKHSLELFLAGVGTEQDMYERMGKENPEEHVDAVFVDKVRRTMMLPALAQKIAYLTNLTGAVEQMAQGAAANGDGGESMIGGLVDQARQMQDGQIPTGMGSGSPGQPRDQNAGVRTSVLDVNTQQAQAGGY